MPTPIRRITAAQFSLLAQPAQLTRKIAAVHVHHTWRPRRQDFRGLATVEAMRKFHMEQNGWSDLAQHLTIEPPGCGPGATGTSRQRARPATTAPSAKGPS